MEVFAIDWLNLLFRWAHLIVGVGWIGTSFYFIALDLSLRRREGQADGIMGSAWLVHGGGFYNVEKFTVAPDHLPDDLVWYKWEAYLTWVTGFALIILQYYLKAESYLIDPSVMALTNLQAIGISLTSLAVGWLAYNGMCRLFLGKSTNWPWRNANGFHHPCSIWLFSGFLRSRSAYPRWGAYWHHDGVQCVSHHYPQSKEDCRLTAGG